MRPMRDFSSARDDLGLIPFLASPLGPLYLRPPALGRGGLIVRHFERQPRGRAAALADLLAAAQRWIAEHPRLARLLRVEQPVEVGHDFVARPHHVYYTSTDAYAVLADDEGDEFAPAPPPELDAMRAAFHAAAAGAKGEVERLLATVLARAAAEPSGKTYFHEGEGRFIAVDLSPRPEELDRWAAISSSVDVPPDGTATRR